MKKTKVGIMGCGKISEIYITNLTGMHSDVIEITAVSDIQLDRAETSAQKFGIPNVLSEEAFYSSDLFSIVLNLTIPKAHYEVSKKALEAGKHVYTEKPLALNYKQGLELLNLAEKKGLRIGGAPDTFLGASGQTARKALDEDMIGEPIAFTAFMMCHGWEIFHPNPDFYYAKGGGPMYDMGPYYLTSLLNLLGPVQSVAAMNSTPIKHREVVIGPRKGEVLPVVMPTHVVGTVRFVNGVLGCMVTTFDVWPIDLPHITIYGTKGTLVVPNPDLFGEKVMLMEGESGKWQEVPLINSYKTNSRGLGLRDMALAIEEGHLHRANGQMLNHVLEIMDAFHSSARRKEEVELVSICERPAPFNYEISIG